MYRVIYRLLPLIAMATLFLVSCERVIVTQDDNDWELQQLQGRVRELSEITISGDSDTTRVDICFDTLGMKTKHTYMQNGELQLASYYTDTLRWQVNGEGEMLWYVVVERDSAGKVTEEYSESESNAWTTYYNYNEQGLLALQTELDADGALSSATQYAYNKRDEKTEETRVDADGHVTSCEEYMYDKRHRLCCIIQSDGDRHIKQKNVFEYDKDGNQIAERYFDGNSNEFYTALSKYENGLLVEKHCYGDYIYDQLYKYMYTDGVLSSYQIIESENGEIAILTNRVCDSRGNWVEETIYEPDSIGVLKQSLCSRRIITYYE